MKLDEVERKRRETLVADQYGGILPIHEAFYIQPIIYAAERSESAFQKFDTAVAASESPNLIFAAVQEGLTHAGALSRFFWPMKKENLLSVARGQKLRSAFFLQEESALKWRRLRNAFEHFDEDLDQFLLQDPVGYIFPSPIIDDEDLADETLANIFKLVDPVQGICVILGEKFEFRPIRAEVQRILSLALKMNGNGSRL